MTGQGAGETTASRSSAERSARLWLRAYPRRWRTASGADLVGTLLDLVEPGAWTVRWRDGVSVVRAGWALRWREHPPLGPWLAYRLFERKLSAQHRAWTMDDLLGRFFLVRRGVSALAVVVTTFLVLSAVFPVLAPRIFANPTGFVSVYGAMVFGLALLPPGPGVRRTWRRHVGAQIPVELRPRSERQATEPDLTGSSLVVHTELRGDESSTIEGGERRG
jgi:hypothetical protein